MSTSIAIDLKTSASTRNITPADFPKLLVEDICVFCEPPTEKVFLETINFYVTYDASPLVEGHLLIHTKEHLGCTGEVGPELFGELQDIKNRVGHLLTEVYGAVSYYEHGRAGHCSIMISDQICHHFHLHAIPITAKIDKVMAKKFRAIRMENFTQMPEFYEQFGTYLFFENSDGEQFFFPAKDDIEPHYLRTTISDALGTPERADYKTYTNLEEINSFIDKVRSQSDEF